MTEKRFRQLLALYAIVLAAAVVASFLPGGYSPALAQAYADEPVSPLLQNPWPALAIVLPLFLAGVCGYVGLFWFKRWARTLSLATTALTIGLILLGGASLSSAPASALFEVASLLWGGILALAHFSTVGARFDPHGPSRSRRDTANGGPDAA